MKNNYRTLHNSEHHFGWDKSLPPAVEIAPGEVVEFEIVDASGGQLNANSTASDVSRLDFGRVNPVTGPVCVVGAEPGDALIVDVQDFDLSRWGWTALIPGFGLLANEFPQPFLHISGYNAERVEFLPGIELPTRPFTGTIGVAPAEPGQHSVIPPRAVGGNMDIRDLVRGARLHLPVQVPGALFSVGDTHAAQGDGEVCGTAIESPMSVRLRFDLRKATGLKRPQIELPASSNLDRGRGGAYVTTGIGPNLHQAAGDAVRDMIDVLQREYQLSPELAYCLCSVAVDLRVSEIVNAPNWLVSAHLPKMIFGS